LPSLDLRQTSNAVALLGFLGPMQEEAAYGSTARGPVTTAVAGTGGTAAAAGAAPPIPPAAPATTTTTTGAPPSPAGDTAPSPVVPPLSHQHQPPQQQPPLPPLPPLKSDLSRRAVPLGAGSSARGTGMLARPSAATATAAAAAAATPAPGGGPTAPPSSSSATGVPPTVAAAARAASSGHHHQPEHQHVPWNPLRRLTGGAHLRTIPSETGPAAGAGSGDSGSAPARAAAAGAPVRQRALGDVIIGDDPNTSVAVPSAAARLYVDMNANEIGEEARAATRGARLVHPLDPRYRLWWMVTIGAALATGWIEPFRIAFLETRSQGVAASPHMWLNALSMAVLALFCLDVVVSFFVGYYDGDGILVMRHRAVARNYIS